MYAVLGGACFKMPSIIEQSPLDAAKCNGLLLLLSRSLASVGRHCSSKETISTRNENFHINVSRPQHIVQCIR